MAFELNVIETMGFPGYFLIVADFIKWAKQHDIPVGPGRGSGAGSVVAWALTITDLNPLQFNLLFERFLNPERISMPDFDIDFCQDRRDEVIRYVQEKYGRDRVAQIITFGKLQARAVLRDVGRVLGMPYGQVDRICKLVPNNPAKPVTLTQAIDGEPALQQMRDEDPAVAKLIMLAIKLEGLYRHASTHAAGVVIGNRPLDEIVPLYRDPRSDIPATQFSMKYVEQASLVKFDFLGLKTLTVLQKAVELIQARGDTIDLTMLPLDDKKTYDMLAKADVTGVFQLESSGMRDVLRKLKPDRFEDIIAIVALYRPGPMDNIPKYIACKHGREQPDYLYPSLEGILKETFGVIIYQEQVMQIAQELSGYSLGGADLLRRAMGKKDAGIMAQQRQEFTKGAVARGVAEKQAGQIYDQVDKFAGYGFNKSHAAAYALVSYQTGYLKANYPVEFLAASMTLDLGNTDKLNTFRQELSRIGVKLLPPDINKSYPVFAVEQQADGTKAIRYALGAVRNVGLAAMESVVRERTANGPFKDLFDFAGRCDPKAVNKRLLESLSAAGAFDSLHKNRAQSHAGVEAMVGHSQASANERTSAQVSLFGWRSDHRADRQGAAADHRLAGDGAVALRVRRHRILSLGASARRLCQEPATPEGHQLGGDPGAAPRRRTGAGQAGRHGGRQEGAHFGARQPLRLRAIVRRHRHVRGHAVLGSAGGGARSARDRQGGHGDGRRQARRRGRAPVGQPHPIARGSRRQRRADAPRSPHRRDRFARRKDRDRRDSQGQGPDQPGVGFGAGPRGRAANPGRFRHYAGLDGDADDLAGRGERAGNLRISWV